MNILADGVSLIDKRHVDRDGHKEGYNGAENAGCICRSWDSAEIEGEGGVCLAPGADEVQSKKESSKEAKEQRKKVDNRDELKTVRLSGKACDDEEHE